MQNAFLLGSGDTLLPNGTKAFPDQYWLIISDGDGDFTPY